MAAELSYTALCKNNQLFIFDALREDESQTGRRLYEDVTDFANSIGRHNYCTRYTVRSRVALVAHLKAIENECKSGVLFPAIHFECHGDEAKGLWLAASGEYIPWPDLAALVMPLNAATRNNLAVLLASCHGFSLEQSVDIKRPSAFQFMIAPSEEISAGAIHDSLLPFYKELIATGDLNMALSHLDSRFKRFIAGEWFYTKLAAFYIHSYGSKARQQLMNMRIDNTIAKAGYANRQLVKAARAEAKRRLNDPREFCQTLEKLFFHGKMPIPYAELKQFIDDQKKAR
jgi:hypothetical protein